MEMLRTIKIFVFLCLAFGLSTVLYPSFATTDTAVASDDHRRGALEPDQQSHSPQLVAGVASECKMEKFLAGDDSPRLAAGSVQSIDWAAIKVLDLKTAAHLALVGNPSLAAAEARVRQALERVRQAQADYWPRLDLTASGEKMWLSDNDLKTSRAMARLSDPTGTVDDPRDRYRTGVSASWKVFDGFARKFANASARYGRDQSEAALEDSRRLIASSIATAYFAAQLIRENVDIARADEKFNQRQLVEARARRHAGTGSYSDELNFEIRINDAHAARIKAERNYEAAIYALAALMGIEKASLPPAVKLAPLEEETKDELVRPNAKALIAYAHEHRPDIRKSEYTTGQASLVRLNEAQRDLVTSQSRLSLAFATLRQAWFNLETDTGRILKILSATYR